MREGTRIRVGKGVTVGRGMAWHLVAWEDYQRAEDVLDKELGILS